MAMTFSQGTRSQEIARFLAVSVADNGFFLLRFFGIAVLACALCRPYSRCRHRFRMQMNFWRLEQPEVVAPSFIMGEA
jgi:hypothetical protein